MEVKTEQSKYFEKFNYNTKFIHRKEHYRDRQLIKHDRSDVRLEHECFIY